VKDETVHRWIVYCLDKRSGRILWEKTVRTSVPLVKRHPKSTHGELDPGDRRPSRRRFLRSEGLYCFDMDGKEIWKKDFGVLDSAFFVAPDAAVEFASSPLIVQDVVLVQCDVLKARSSRAEHHQRH